MKHTIAIIFLSLVALLGLNSCSKNINIEEKTPEKLFGIWKYQYESNLIKNNGHTDTDHTIKYIDDVSKFLKIEADGTYSIYYIEYVTSSFSTKTELEWGTWKWKNKVRENIQNPHLRKINEDFVKACNLINYSGNITRKPTIGRPE